MPIVQLLLLLGPPLVFAAIVWKTFDRERPHATGLGALFGAAQGLTIWTGFVWSEGAFSGSWQEAFGAILMGAFPIAIVTTPYLVAGGVIDLVKRFRWRRAQR